MLTSQRLHHIFPTPASVLTAKQSFSNWDDLAKSVGVSKDALLRHRKALGIDVAVGKKKKAEHLTDSEIRKNIRKMFKDEITNVVTTYKADLEVFMKNPCGMDGLELVGMEQGVVWGEKKNPYVRRQGMK